MRFRTRYSVLAMCLLFLGSTVLAVIAQSQVIATAYGTVNVRSGPGISYPVIGQLTVDTVVEVTGRSDSESNWLRINFNGREGWVAYFTVNLEGNLSRLPIVAPATIAPSFPVLTATPTALVTTGDLPPMVQLIRRVNVRSGPGTDFERVGLLYPGDTAPIIGRTDDSQWLQIEFENASGWVSVFVVGVSGGLDAVPVVDNDVEITVVPASTPVATLTPVPVSLTTRYNSNLRAAPTISASILIIVPFETTLPIERRSADGRWLRVTYRGETGWISRSLVTVDSPRALNTLPIDIPRSAE